MLLETRSGWKIFFYKIVTNIIRKFVGSYNSNKLLKYLKHFYINNRQQQRIEV